MTQPSQHNEQVIDQFTRQAQGYTQLITSLRARGRHEALTPIGAHANDVALDVACGSGGLTIPMAGIVKHITGVDVTPAMIERAKAIQFEQGLSNIAWFVGHAAALAFDDGTFSLVLCSAAFHHLEVPRDVLCEMTRVCRDGGRIAVVDMAFPPEKAISFDRLERMRDPSHVHAHTLGELRALADGFGLTEVVVEPYLTPDLPLEAILKTSHPALGHSTDDIRALIAEDARLGADRYGLHARQTDGELFVSYPMATVVWRK
jgi:ubiquinone/menaquinone biosynthesis C-methylase UbiE